MVGEGKLGDIREVHVSSLSGASLDPATPLHWRERVEYSGANVMTFGIYAEVISRWLGPTRRVLADGATFITSRVDAETGERHTIEVPDSLGVFATLESGARVTYRFSNVAHSPAPGSSGISIYGSLATLHWEVGDRMSLAPLGGEPSPLTPDEGTDGAWRVEEDFIDSIRKGAPVQLTNFEDGFHYMQIIDAVRTSRLEGRAMQISRI